MKIQLVLQAFLEKETVGLLKCFLLTNYEVTFVYEKNLKSQMEIETDHQYLMAEIAYGKRMVKQFVTNPELVSKVLVHELTHILTSRLTDGKKGLSKQKYLELEEQTNEHISKVFFNLWYKK